MLTLLVLIPTLLLPIPVVEIGEGERKVEVYQANDKTCVFEFSKKGKATETLFFYEEVDCRDVAFQYRYDR